MIMPAHRIDVIVKRVALILKLFVMTTMLVLMILVIRTLDVFSLKSLAMMMILVLSILVVPLMDVFSLKRFVMTTISAPTIPAMRITAFVNMCQ